MNKILRLINELCPKGVVYRKLDEICNYEQPTKYIVKSTEYNNMYKTPVLTAGKSFILGYTNENFGIYLGKENSVIIFDDFTTSFHWVDFNFKIKSSAMKIITKKNNLEINFRYIYYAMKCIGYQPQDHARHWISKYSKFEIPIPPIEIQEEIVNILDNFTNLDIELKEELEKRKKQYEFYREELLTFGDDVENIPLKNFCKVGDGLHATPKYDLNGDFFFINGNNLKNGKIIFNNNTKNVNVGEYRKHGIEFSKNKSIFMSINGTIGNVAFFNDEKIVLGKSVAYFNIESENIERNFIYYLLQTNESEKYYQANKTGSVIKNLGLKVLREFKIPIPSKQQQQDIVNKLDKFDNLIKEIETEIKLRQKQYEFYREKLLNFKKLN